MAWIESHTVLEEHPKVREIAKILNIEVVVLIGHLHCFWHRVLELREDGDITQWTEQDISYYARWNGDANLFYNSLLNRFIDEKNGFKLVHDWLEYAGRYLATKYRNTNPKLLKRIEKKHNLKGRNIGQPKGQPKGRILDGQDNLTLPNLKNQKNTDVFSSTSFSGNEKIATAWGEFKEHRRQIKHPLTELAESKAVAKLIKLSYGNPSTAVEIINESIAAGWQGLFELKKKPFSKSEENPGSQRIGTGKEITLQESLSKIMIECRDCGLLHQGSIKCPNCNESKKVV